MQIADELLTEMLSTAHRESCHQGITHAAALADVIADHDLDPADVHAARRDYAARHRVPDPEAAWDQAVHEDAERTDWAAMEGRRSSSVMVDRAAAATADLRRGRAAYWTRLEELNGERGERREGKSVQVTDETLTGLLMDAREDQATGVPFDEAFAARAVADGHDPRDAEIARVDYAARHREPDPERARVQAVAEEATRAADTARYGPTGTLIANADRTLAAYQRRLAEATQEQGITLSDVSAESDRLRDIEIARMQAQDEAQAERELDL